MGANIAGFPEGRNNFSIGKRRRLNRRDARLDAIFAKSLQHPRSLDEIVKCTRFSKPEVRLLYRSFKQDCPGGHVSEERLREIYLQLFPQGNTHKYAHYLFSIIDRNHRGTFTFDDYILTLSVLCRGTVEEKLRWIFRLYDINGEGQLTRENITEMILSLYDLLGPSVQPRVEECDIREHVNEIFETMGAMSTEEIALEDFIEYCKRFYVDRLHRSSKKDPNITDHQVQSWTEIR